MSSNCHIAAYAEGAVCPPNLAGNLQNIKNAGWDTIMVSLFHVETDGSITINGNPLETSWNEQLMELKTGGTVKTLLATFGGWDDVFTNIQTIYNNNNNSFEGTALQANAAAFKQNFPAFDLIDMDVEYPNGPPENYQACVTAFCEMWIQLGYGITFCPYTDTSFWTGMLVTLEQSYPGAVKWWNLQCYAGGGGNKPADWNTAIQQALPGFNTDGYIWVSDWTRFWDVEQWGSFWNGHCPAAVQSWIGGFAGPAYIGGAFLWTIDQILDYEATTKQHPDPESCGPKVVQQDYVNALIAGLG